MNGHALIVGINQYEDENIRPLRYALEDARRVDRFLHGCGFRVRSLTDSEATYDHVERTLYSLLDQTREGDVFVFYFAGHGLERGRGEGRRQYLLLRNTLLRSVGLEGGSVLGLGFLQECTYKPGVRRAIVLDCCRSQMGISSRGGSAQSHYSRRDVKVVAESSPQDSPLVIACSCQPDHNAHEHARLDGGLFTRAMLTVFADHRRRGLAVGFHAEAQTAIKEQTALLAQKFHLSEAVGQSPWIEGDFGGVVLIPGTGGQAEGSVPLAPDVIGRLWLRSGPCRRWSP